MFSESYFTRGDLLWGHIQYVGRSLKVDGIFCSDTYRLAAYALNIIRERYNDFGPTLTCEKLPEVHGAHLSKEMVRKLMTQAG